MSSFSDCQQHENITVKILQWDEEMKTLLSSFFLYGTWHNYPRFYNCMILGIITIMFIYLVIVAIWDPWILIFHSPVSFVRQICRAETSSLPWTLVKRLNCTPCSFWRSYFILLYWKHFCKYCFLYDEKY